MDDKRQAQKMVWMMLLATIATYMALPAMIEPLSSEGPAPVLPMAFAAIALSMAGAIFAIPSLMSRLPVADEEQAAHRPGRNVPVSRPIPPNSIRHRTASTSAIRQPTARLRSRRTISSGRSRKPLSSLAQIAAARPNNPRTTMMRMTSPNRTVRSS